MYRRPNKPGAAYPSSRSSPTIPRESSVASLRPAQPRGFSLRQPTARVWPNRGRAQETGGLRRRPSIEHARSSAVGSGLSWRRRRWPACPRAIPVLIIKAGHRPVQRVAAAAWDTMLRFLKTDCAGQNAPGDTRCLRRLDGTGPLRRADPADCAKGDDWVACRHADIGHWPSCRRIGPCPSLWANGSSGTSTASHPWRHGGRPLSRRQRRSDADGACSSSSLPSISVCSGWSPPGLAGVSKPLMGSGPSRASVRSPLRRKKRSRLSVPDLNPRPPAR